MRIQREQVAREEVIRFYAAYDRRKKREPPVPDIAAWPWNDPDGLDRKLSESGLKKGVLAAYKFWRLVELNVADLLECAVVIHIFPREPQALGQLILGGKLAKWLPIGEPEWWQVIGNGSGLDLESALIMRPACRSEAPAKWYLEDGSGRALALLQSSLGSGEMGRTAWAYLGHEPDEHSAFIKSHPELML